MDRASRDLQRVPLAVAAAVVLSRVAGETVEGRRDPETASKLNTVARALANVAPIYTSEPHDHMRELTPIDLLGGEFDEGAQLFRAKDGRQFSALVIERRDMLTAITVLRAAGVQFR